MRDTMFKSFTWEEKFRMLTPRLLVAFTVIAFVASGCSTPTKEACDCPHKCNKVANGLCIKCTDHNCTPVGTAPCCEECNCQ